MLLKKQKMTNASDFPASWNFVICQGQQKSLQADCVHRFGRIENKVRFLKKDEAQKSAFGHFAEVQFPNCELATCTEYLDRSCSARRALAQSIAYKQHQVRCSISRHHNVGMCARLSREANLNAVSII